MTDNPSIRTDTAETEIWDVIIVGAGPAGAAAAWDLAVAGKKVLLLDKKAFPRFKPCAGGLTTKALLRLRFPVDEVVRYRADRMAISLYLKRDALLEAPDTICALTVRTELDDFCLKKAQEQGAAFQLIKGLANIEETPKGVLLHTRCGKRYKADYLIGADGAHSQVRKLASDFEPDRTAVAIEGVVPLNRCHHSPDFRFDFGVVKQGYGWLFPKGDHVNVGIYTRRPEEAVFNKQVLKEYCQRRLGADQIDHMCGYPIGTGGEKFIQKSDRVFLVGDAAGHAEALLGEGLHNAIKAGQIAANSIILAEREGEAGVLFRQYIYEVTHDIDNCRSIAKAFYKFLPISYGVLKHGVSSSLMNGFARGLTLTECKRALLTPGSQYQLRSQPLIKPR